MRFKSKYIENFLNSGNKYADINDERRFKFNLINLIMLLGALSGPIIGLLHLNQLYGYNSLIHAINCFIFVFSQISLIFFLRHSPTKINLISYLLVISIFLIFTSNLIFSTNENVRILWFVVFLFVSDIVGGDKLRHQALFSVVILLAIFLAIPDLAVNLLPVDIFSSLLILMLSATILHYYRLKLKNTQMHLKDSEIRHRTIFESTVDGIINIKDNGIIVSVNPAIEKLFGYTLDELIGNNIAMLMPEPYSSKHDIFIKMFKQTGNATILGIGKQLSAKKKDGSIFPIDIALDKMVVHGEQMFTGIIRDITERAKAEQEIISSKEVAEQATQAKSQFLSSMSHELRTPLNAILGFAQLLEINAKDELSKNNSQEIIDAGKHLLTLINEVLDLSKIESGAVDLSIKSHSFNKIFKDTLSFIQPIADKHAIRICNKVSLSSDIKIDVDETRFKQVLLNVLSNAIKYNSENGDVIIDCLVNNEKMLYLSVTDTGKGLTAEQQQKIFLPFDRAGKENSNIEGTGLGLSISKNFIEKMGGKITVESEIGKGSCFSIQIPLT